jgi:hypothetical protein
MSLPKPWRWLCLLGAVGLGAVLTCPASAQNLDAGKSAPRLFADSCAECHRSAHGLAKGRISLTLYLFLKDHYSSGSGAAWALTSYLESVDGSKSGRTRGTATKKPSRHGPTRSPPRPPASVPER